MGLFAVIGIILIAVGVLGLLSLVDIPLTISILLIVAGILFVLVDMRGYIRRP